MASLDLLKEKGVCCVSGKALNDSKQLNWVKLEMKATWAFPVWGNLLSGKSQMALAFVHDDVIVNGKLEGDVKHAVEINGDEIVYHPYLKEILNWNQLKKGFDTSQYSDQNLDRLKKIRKDCLHLFGQSIGWKFRVKGTELTDTVAGVNTELQLVQGEEYGEFHVDLCELTNDHLPASNNQSI